MEPVESINYTGWTQDEEGEDRSILQQGSEAVEENQAICEAEERFPTSWEYSQWPGLEAERLQDSLSKKRLKVQI